MSEPAQKKEGAGCPQCLLTQDIDCHEEGCPGVGGFVELEKKGAAAPDLKMCLTMGLRIAALENLITRLWESWEGRDSFEDLQAVMSELGSEYRRMAHEKKRGRAV